jgi:hypothetical protein
MEDWKKDRLSFEINENEKKIMAEAIERKRKIEDEKWGDICEELYVGDRTMDDYIDLVINKLREKYQLPIKK